MGKRGPKEESLVGNYSTKWGKGDQKKKVYQAITAPNGEKGDQKKKVYQAITAPKRTATQKD